MASLKVVLADAQKAVRAFAAIEAAAVGLGVLDNAVAGYITAALGAVTAAIVYLTDNAK